MKRIIAFVFLVTMMSACSKELSNDTETKSESTVFSAKIVQPVDENATKTHLGPLSEGFRPVLWDSEDKIAVWADDATTSVEFTLSKGSGAEKGEFSGPEFSTLNKAFYPSYFVQEESKIIVPTIQVYTEGGIANGSMPMIGLLNTETGAVDFLSAMSILKINVNAAISISKIVVLSNTQVLSGEATISTSNTIEWSSDETRVLKYVELDCGLGVDCSEGVDFNIIVPAGLTGFTIRLVSSTGHVMEKTKTLGSAIQANHIRPMASLTSFTDSYGGKVMYVDGGYIGEGITLTNEQGSFTFAPVNLGYDEKVFPFGKFWLWGTRTSSSEQHQWTGVTRTHGPELKVVNPMNYPTSADAQGWSDGEKLVADPCPAGWRVPSYEVLVDALLNGAEKSRLDYDADQFQVVNDCYCVYFDGHKSTSPVSGLLLASAGCGGNTYRGSWGFYTSSSLNGQSQSNVNFYASKTETYVRCNKIGHSSGKYQFSLRCIKEAE